LGVSCCAATPLSADPEACAPRIEENWRWKTASLRVGEGCTVDEESFREAVAAWLKERRADAPLTGLFLGRAVGLPWVSHQIAAAALQSESWRARTETTDEFALVTSFLSEPAFLNRLAEPFAGSGYAIESISVEKILVGEAADVVPGHTGPPARVPYDALVSVRLREEAQP
jgi:hypothetical protein